ncbi:hypothetical protein [Blastopirellula marina]|uniref:Uncharacterized protein n=1 Tax=Blastopirellula marina TaxID=124 RepID=A0A2S8GCM5_9BACT|nr:hypothetical protein [Blastopirellula marina]PQO42173.1 hypothetical protein C5Y93_27900 [Blastopirellula marina]
MQPSIPQNEIERLVRLVVERLVAEGKPGNKPAQPIIAAGEVRLDGKLVTLSSLEGKLNASTRVLCVPTKAVVTPAVKDELRQRKIELRRADQVDNHGQPKLPPVVNAAKQSVSSVWDTSGRSERLGSLPSAIERAVVLAQTEQMAVLLSDQPEVAAAAANRTSGIRAMVACESHDWKSAAESLGANVVVCHPGNWNDANAAGLLATLWDLRGTAGPTWLK